MTPHWPRTIHCTGLLLAKQTVRVNCTLREGSANMLADSVSEFCAMCCRIRFFDKSAAQKNPIAR